MMILVTYDVNTETKQGANRLRKIAKKCQNYGQRVQNSVFECYLDAGQYHKFKNELISMIDNETDNFRFYQLGNKYQSKIESFGNDISYDPEESLII